MATWHYLPARRWTPLVPLRRWLSARRCQEPVADGEEYVGLSVRVADNAGPDLPPPGTRGTVAGVEPHDGVLHHRIEFPGPVVVTVPMAWPDQAWPGIDLLAPS